MVTFFNLVPLAPDDPLLEWLQQLDCWSEIEQLWGEINSSFTEYIPLPVELELKDELKLDPNCLYLFEKLQHERNEILLEKLGVDPNEVQDVLKEGDCSWTHLVQMNLARIQGSKVLPLDIALDKRVHYLVGLSPTL